MAGYQSPGAAATSGIFDFLAMHQKNKMLQREHELEAQRLQLQMENAQSEHALKVEMMRAKQMEDERQAKEAETKDALKGIDETYTEGMWLDPSDPNVKKAAQLGVLRQRGQIESQAPVIGAMAPPPGVASPAIPIKQGLTPELGGPAGIRFASPAIKAQQQQEAKRVAYLNSLDPNDPNSAAIAKWMGAADAMGAKTAPPAGIINPASHSANLQRAEGLMDGKLAYANFHPDTGKYTHPDTGAPMPGFVPKPTASTAEVTQAPEISTMRPDPKTGNIPDMRTGMTPNNAWMSGLTWAVTGAMQPMGMGSAQQVREARMLVSNMGSQMAVEAGTDLPSLRAEYRAKGGALADLTKRYAQTSAAAGGAKDQLQLAIDQSKNVGRTQVPLVNRFLQWMQSGDKALVGNPDLSQLELYIYSAARDYAKVTSGSAGSVAAPTDTAQRIVDKLLSAAQTPETFAKVAEGMQNDMDKITGNQLKEISKTSSLIADFLGTVTGQRVPAGQTGAGTTKKQTPQDLLKKYW